LIAAGRTASRYLNIYTTRKTRLLPTLLTNQPPTDAKGEINKVEWSTNGDYLVASSYNASAGCYAYKRTGYTFAPMTVTSNRDYGVDCSISANGEILAYRTAQASTGTSDNRVFHNANGTLTLLNIGTTTPNGACAVSSDGKYVALLNTVAPFLEIRIRSGSGNASAYTTSMVLAAQPLVGSSNRTSALAFSPDDTYLCVVPYVSGYQKIYKLDTTTNVYVQLAAPFSGTNPIGTMYGAAWSSDGTLLAISSNNTQTLIYQRSGDAFTSVATLTGGYRGGFHPSGEYYITGSGQVYKKGSTATSWTAQGSTVNSSMQASGFSPYLL